MSNAGPPPPPGGSPTSGDAEASTTMLMVPHLTGLIGFVGPLILFLVPNDDPRVRRHAAAALNWQLSHSLYLFGSVLIIMVLVVLDVFTEPLFFVSTAWLIGLVLYNVVICVVVAVKGSNGVSARYPGAIPMFSA